MAGLKRSFQAAQMLGRLLTGRVDNHLAPIRQHTIAGTAYDLYEPPGPPISTVMLLYGFAYKGEKDRRVQNFARALSGSGLRVVVPVLPGLKSFTFCLEDLDCLEDLVSHVTDRFQTRLRVVAFSFGAGLSLIAAGQPWLADRIELLLLFDPPYSLAQAWQEFQKLPATRPDQKWLWQAHIWDRLVLTYRFQHDLPLTDCQKEDLLAVLRMYDQDKTDAERFDQEVMQKLKLPPLQALLPPGDIMVRLSPAGQLAGVKATVFIIHDAQYERLAVTHSERILAELSAAPAGGKHQLLATAIIAHVHPRWSWQLLDIFPLLQMFAALYNDERPEKASRSLAKKRHV